jgi:hypothetical protein
MTTAKPPTTTTEIHTMSPHLTDLFAAFRRDHIQGLRDATAARHAMERESDERYVASLFDAAPAPTPAPAPMMASERPFPDERHLYRGSLETMRGVGYRPRRWRSDGSVEYAYKTGGKLRAMAALCLGTVGMHGMRWVTVTELIRCRAFDRSGGRS